MPPSRQPFQQVLVEHRARLSRVIERRGVERVKGLYDDAQAELEARLARATGRSGSQFTAHTSRLALAQVRQGQVVLAQRVAGELGDISQEAQIESIRGLAGDLTKLSKVYRGTETIVPIDEAATLRGLVGKRAAQLDEMHASTVARWGARMFDQVHEQLSLSVATGETSGEAVKRVMNTTEGEWWQGERIVRTELSFAFNAAHVDGIEAAQEYVPEIMQRWVEHCDDSTGQPLDDRVAEDSIAMHGQVVRPGGLFVMPEDPDVREEMWGMRWPFPPNRPNDRATVLPFFPGMGVIAWELRGGVRVDIA